MKRTGNKIIAFVMIFTIMATVFSLTNQVITARALSSAILENGTLILKGNVVLNDVRAFSGNEAVKKVVCDENAKLPVDCSEMFKNFDYVTSVDLSNANTSSVEQMSSMFFMCRSLTTIEISGWDTSNVIDMNYMFTGCGNLSSLDISNWDTAHLLKMRNMFGGTGLTSLDLSGWDTSSVTEIGGLFMGCSALESLDLSGLNTSLVSDMNFMFQNCRSLLSLDLSEWDTSSVEFMYNMFDGCSNLVTIYVSDKWTIMENTDGTGMFNRCYALVGGNGTTYSGSQNNEAYAYIDNEAHPGYFTQSPLNTISLTLSDDLSLNFFVDGLTPENVADYKVILKGKCAENGQNVPLIEKNGKYCASANVSANNMAEHIIAQLYKKDSNEWVKICTRSYSVNQYLNNVKPEETWTFEQKTTFMKLVDTVKLYGEVSNSYFGSRDKMPVVTDYSTDINAVDTAGNSVFAPTFSSNQATISLVLNTKLAVRVYVKELPDNAVAQFGTQSLNTMKACDGRFFFEFTGFKPTQLDEKITFTISNDETDYTFVPFSWAYRVMNADNAAVDDITMANILYEYFTNARSFVASMKN